MTTVARDFVIGISTVHSKAVIDTAKKSTYCTPTKFNDEKLIDLRGRRRD